MSGRYGYLDRWNDDIKHSSGAFSLTVLVTLPTLVVGYGQVSGPLLILICIVGLFEGFFGTAVTAILDNIAWKAVVYLMSVVFNLSILWGLMAHDPGGYASDATNMFAILIPQILIAFPLFYLMIVRRGRARR